jgi:hypothetical protein
LKTGLSRHNMVKITGPAILNTAITGPVYLLRVAVLTSEFARVINA